MSLGVLKLLSLRESRRPFLDVQWFYGTSLGLYLPRSPSLAPKEATCGGHVWNHLVSQKTWQNDEKKKCNVRSAQRGERRGEREEKIERSVQACDLKSSAQKVSQHRLRDFNLEAQIVTKCIPKGPLESLWTRLGQPLGVRGALLGGLGAPGTLFGAPWELCGAPRELFGSSGE